ncbi:hypothetical protein ACODG4_08700 [Vagococcus fluvialis]|uniref:hypothetical protein n=1 Tax=Vagococcus fluvialis TaxID=2738 RepID=UPI003B5A2D48
MKKILAIMSIYILNLISLVVCILSVKTSEMVNMGYGNLWLLPLTFLIVNIFFFSSMMLQKRSFTSYLLILYSLLRFVIQPLLSVVTNSYESLNMYTASRESNELAVILMSYELLVISLLIMYLVNKNDFFSFKNIQVLLTKKKELLGNNFFYLVFICFSLIVYFLLGRGKGIFSFIFLKVNEVGIRVGDVTDFKSIAIKQIILAGLIFFFLVVSSQCSKKFNQTNNKKYIIYALLAAMLNISIIVGERRSVQVYTCVSTIYILYLAFPKYSKLLVTVVGVSSLSIIVLMSVYKFLNTFIFGSYAEALKNSSVNTDQWSTIFSAYFGGVELLGTAIDMKKVGIFSVSNVFYDFLRSTFGISFFMKDNGVLTSEMFNTFIYGVQRQSGQLLPSVGYGYLYFGFFLSPIFTVLNVLITYFFEKKMLKTNSLEMGYIYSFIFVRFGTSIFQITPPLISMATQYLCTIGLVYLVSKMLNNQKKVELNEKSFNS